MQRHLLIILMVLLGWITSLAQSSALFFGVRAGAVTCLPSAPLHAACRSAIGVDLGYLFHHPIGREAEIGFLFGADVAFAQLGLRAKETISYPTTDYLGHPLQYSIEGNIQEQISQIQVAIPLMLAFRFEHVQFHLGPRLALPFMAHYRQKTTADIQAFYPEYGVTISNELITGKLTPDQQLLVGEIALPTIQAQVGTSLAYEWELNSSRRANHHIGLGAYFFYTVWNNGSQSLMPPSPVITVSPISSATDPAAKVTVLPLTSSYSPQLLPIETGVRFYYSLGVANSSPVNIHKHPYNRLKHHPRILLD